MALELITVTADNKYFAITENFRRIYEELRFKVPLNGTVVLQGDWDFADTYTFLGVEPAGPNSATNNADA